MQRPLEPRRRPGGRRAACLCALVLASGCSQLLPTAPPWSQPVINARVLDRGVAAAGIQRLLIWPTRNDAGADLLLPGVEALLRIHREGRDRMAAGMTAQVLQTLDEALLAPLRSTGVVVVTTPEPPPGEDLTALLETHTADALLVVRITGWDRDTHGPTVGSTLVSGRLELLRPGESRPLWSWEVRRHLLAPPPAPRHLEQAQALWRQAGADLALALRP